MEQEAVIKEDSDSVSQSLSHLLEMGVEFESFDAFQAAMEQYEDTHFVQFSRIDSRSVEKAQELTPTKVYNPSIQFVQLTYACTFGPRKVASRSNGIRISISKKIDCPVRLRLSSTPDGQRLVVRESKLTGHNHEVNEEQYKSMSRQKLLDEETEMEIYKLVSDHSDKRLARMLVKDRLTQEMGRSISIKDIINIEKKIFRRLEKERLSAPASDRGKVEKPEEVLTNEAAQEVDEKKLDDAKVAELRLEENTKQEEEHADTGQGEGACHKGEDCGMEGETTQTQPLLQDGGELEEKEGSQQETNDIETQEASGEETKVLEVEPPAAKKLKTEEQTTPATPSSSSRPQRHRREPRRFREAVESGDKAPHTSHDRVFSILTPEQARQIGAELVSVAPRAHAAKSREEMKVSRGKRGRPSGGVKQSEQSAAGMSDGVKQSGMSDGVKQSGMSDGVKHSDEDRESNVVDGDAEYRRRKLAIQQELLDLEKRKMKVLDDIVAKLDLIIERQEKG